MTDHDRARLMYRFACALSDVAPKARGGRPWLARILGITPSTAQKWGEDDWPVKAKLLLQWMAEKHPIDWPDEWRV